MRTQRKSFLMNVVVALIGAAASGVQVVVGPNLVEKTKEKFVWSARREDEGADKNQHQQIICLKNVSVTRSLPAEQEFGCNHRAKGDFCGFDEVPKNLTPVFLDGCLLSFHTRTYDADGEGYTRNYVKISHLVLLPNGAALGVVTGKNDAL